MPDLRTLDDRRAVATRGSSWPEALGKEGVTGTLVPVQEGRLRRSGLSRGNSGPGFAGWGFLRETNYGHRLSTERTLVCFSFQPDPHCRASSDRCSVSGLKRMVSTF